MNETRFTDKVLADRIAARRLLAWMQHDAGQWPAGNMLCVDTQAEIEHLPPTDGRIKVYVNLPVEPDIEPVDTNPNTAAEAAKETSHV